MRFKVIGCLLALALHSGCGRGELQPSVPDERPDVALILIDTLRQDHLDLYGYPKETAPFLAELAKRSAVFDRAYSTSSWTAPATATVLTGLYPPRHGVVMGFNAYGKEQGGEAYEEDELSLTILPREVPTLGEMFAAGGYQTFAVSSNVNVSPERGFTRGFDRFERRRQGDAEELAEILVEWAGTRDPDKPALWYLHMNDVHKPYNPRRPYYKAAKGGLADMKARYDSEIRYVDELLRRLWSELGWDDSTIVCVLSDHGEEFRDHGQLGHRFQLYGELLNVALLLRAPDFTEPGMRIDVPVSLIDVLPTLAELAGLKDPGIRDGASLLGLMDGGRLPDRALFAHRGWPRSDRAIWAVIDDGHKLILDDINETIEVYDTNSDPLDKGDLAPDNPELVSQLMKELEGFRSIEALETTRATIPVDESLDRHLREMGYAGDDEEDG